MGFVIRQAEVADCPVILEFIRGLAVYEHMEDDVVCTVELLSEWLFEKKKASVLLAFEGDVAVGMALYFYSFSTFLGRAGIYLEDLFVLENFRGKGYGKALLLALVDICKAEGLGRLEWSCLNWNTPSLEFYDSLGAERMEEWVRLRLTVYDS